MVSRTEDKHRFPIGETRRKEKGGEKRMKHVNALSKPVKAEEETAWVEFRNVFGKAPLDQTEARWVYAQVDHFLTK